MKCIFILIVVVFVSAWVCVSVVPLPVDHHHKSACQLTPGDAYCNSKHQV